MRRTYVRRSEHEMKRNAKIGLFTKPSILIGICIAVSARKTQKRTGLEEIAIYNLDLDCYHAKGNLIMTKSWWKMIQNPTFNFKKSLISKVLQQFCLRLSIV